MDARTALVIGLLAFASPLSASATDPPRQIVKECVVAASRADVWRAWTTNDGVRTFFSSDSRVELRLGGPYEIYFATDAEVGLRGAEGCRVLSFVHERMLSFTWNAPPKFGDLRAERTFVVVELADAGAGKTRVTLTHAGWPEGKGWDGVHAYFDTAWGHVLGNLQKRFDSGPLWPDEAAAAPAAHPARSRYVYFIRPARPDFFDGPTADEEKALAEHAAYIRALNSRAALILAGPCTEPTQFPSGQAARPLELPTPGIVIFEAADDAEAKRVMENDPAVKAGVFMARVNPIRIAYQRQ